MREQLGRLPLRNAKCASPAGEGVLQKMKPAAGDVLDQARKGAGLEVKQMAGEMGTSESLIHRGLKSQEHLSFHRLWELSDDFWAELIVAIAKRRRVAVVRTTIELSGEKRKSA